MHHFSLLFKQSLHPNGDGLMESCLLMKFHGFWGSCTNYIGMIYDITKEEASVSADSLWAAAGVGSLADFQCAIFSGCCIWTASNVNNLTFQVARPGLARFLPIDGLVQGDLNVIVETFSVSDIRMCVGDVGFCHVPETREAHQNANCSHSRSHIEKREDVYSRSKEQRLREGRFETGTRA